MEELYEILGLDPGAPQAKVVQEVKLLKASVEDKNEIIVGLQEKIKNQEEQIESIADGVAEARVRDLVNKVQQETGFFVGKDHIANLQKKAAQYLYADEEDQASIYSDMKAHTLAYGIKASLDERINRLVGERDEGDTDEERRYKKAEKLINSGKAKNWQEARRMVIEQEEKSVED